MDSRAACRGIELAYLCGKAARVIEFTFRPLSSWPYPDTKGRRSRRTFSASWMSTIYLLRKEIASLKGHDPIIAVVADESEIRRDGLLRANAQVRHPGIEISFDASKAMVGGNGRLIYATDICMDWQHNVRSIALGLGALRAVDRYGITRRGEQYAGFAALPAGGPDVVKGERLVKEAGSMREALFKHHPDQGGNATDFIDVLAYREKVEANGT